MLSTEKTFWAMKHHWRRVPDNERTFMMMSIKNVLIMLLIRVTLTRYNDKPTLPSPSIAYKHFFIAIFVSIYAAAHFELP